MIWSNSDVTQQRKLLLLISLVSPEFDSTTEEVDRKLIEESNFPVDETVSGSVVMTNILEVLTGGASCSSMTADTAEISNIVDMK